MLAEMIGRIPVEERTDPGLLRDKVRDEVRRFLRKRSGRRPLVLPVIMEI
jgi:ribonuclease J